MPRTARAIVGDYCYHVINRGNGRAEDFHAEGDDQAFVNLLGSRLWTRCETRTMAQKIDGGQCLALHLPPPSPIH
jgi:hypothetical protein